MLTKTRQRRLTNDPATWAADLTRPAVDAASLGVSDLTHIAAIAGGSCRPAGTADGDTVATLASNGQHAADALSTSADTPAIRLPIPNVSADRSPLCEHCGAAFVARRPWARFCSAYCRRVAWLDRNPERAAELAERDKARYRAHIIGNGGTWQEVH
jgi:hypothetical protein